MYTIGYFVGSLAEHSVNRVLSRALIRIAPDDLAFVEIPIKDLPLYNRDRDADYPSECRALKERIAAVDAVLFVTPEYNRGIPGALKNAIDWGSGPWGSNSFAHKPAAVIGASRDRMGTAAAQQSLRNTLNHCRSTQMNVPEVFVHFTLGLITDDGEVTDETVRQSLANFMGEFRMFVARALTGVSC